MFPALVPKPEHDELPPPIPPALHKLVASYLPSLQNKSGTYSPLQHIDQLLPLIKREIKESRSQAAQDLLIKMAINNKLLYYELSAVRIQAVVRRFVSKLQVERIRRRTELFMRITEDCAARYLEEFVLSSCLELSLGFYRQHRRFKLLHGSVERELLIIIDQLRDEVLLECISEVATETVSDVIDVVVRMRNAANLSHEQSQPVPAAPSPTKIVKMNPLVTLVDSVLDGAVTVFIRGVACQAVLEEAEEYLLQQNCERIYASVASEVMLDVLVDVVQIYFGDQVDSSDALVGSLYERIYAQYQSTSQSNDNSNSSSSKASMSPSAVNRMKRRSTYRSMDLKG